MSIADELEEEQPKPSHQRRVEWDGDEGRLETGVVGPEFNPHDHREVLEALGENPDEIKIRLTNSSRWSTAVAVRDEEGNRTGEYRHVWNHAYKYAAVRNALSVDLPALYAEVAKTRKPKRSNWSVGESTVVVCWADVQTGKVDHLGGLQELLERLDQKRAALEEYLKSNLFDQIVVADCGDLIEGYSNFPAQHRTNCLSIMDQIDVAATEMWKTIRLCTKYAPVDVLSIPSNHCAWRKDGKNLAGKVSDDWGLAISKMLERRNEDAHLPVTFHRSDEWDETLQFDIRSTRLGLAHGHQASNPDQVKTWWGKMTHAGVLDCDVLLTGHFHFASLRPSGKNATTGRSRWHIQAPTLDNGSSWVRNKYGEDGDPALAVFQINNDGFDLTSFGLL